MIPENEETVQMRLDAADIMGKLPQAVSHRIGNWTEESILREEKLKEFLAKYDRGASAVAQNERRLQLARREEQLSSSRTFNAPLMFRNADTEMLLALDIPDSYPDGISDDESFTLTTAPERRAVARCCWRVQPYTRAAGSGDPELVFGAKVYITLTGMTERPLYLTSETKSFTRITKVSKSQDAYASFHKDYRSVWQIEYPDPSIRPEMEGSRIDPGTAVILRHCQTGSALSSDSAYTIRNDFGMEHEVACHLNRDNGTRVELAQNRWHIVTQGNS
ncbi:hypothetical protein HKX48_004772 [Thoreauomyces humboldtii]|nr:hypothetical protein HKX48_004772 [Thoreauomyces humboldtii]